MYSLFSSPQRLQDAFDAGLLGLARQDGLGPFILACANATFDARLFDLLQSPLRERFADLAETYSRAFREGRDIQVVEEDLLVFLKMHAVGFDALQQTEFRQEGDWRVQFNHLRSFRPRRISQNVPQGIAAPFNPDGFNFNRPFMLRESFWQGDLLERPLALYYNKYPFAPLHCLFVPEREACLPQLLTAREHRYIWEVTQTLALHLPGLGFGYNGFGAYASVNHLHFQMFVDPDGLPVMREHWLHNGGNKPYSAACVAFDDVDAAWIYIAALHERVQPYNALYLAGRCYVFPRRPQGTVAGPAWSSGFSWYELAGGMLTFNQDDYSGLQALDIERALGQLRPA